LFGDCVAELGQPLRQHRPHGPAVSAPDHARRCRSGTSLGLLLGVDSKSGYKPADFGGRAYRGDKKVLVLCTEERYLEMTNGALFSTGHNVQETAVPLMHLSAAGFEFDVVTPSGAPAVLEQWSVPKKDRAVLGFMRAHKARFDRPLSLASMVAGGALDEGSPYVAVFFPGGHGAMVGVPEDPNVAALVRWSEQTGRWMVVVCHGPAALMAARGDGAPHPYAGYEMVAFPDKVDRQSPAMGYLPGVLPWFPCEELEAQSMKILNDDITGATHVDRKLVSGDSPKACDALGKYVAHALLDELTAPVGKAA
jgi:molecular chaperone Hsp31 and glyoxalase 3